MREAQQVAVCPTRTLAVLHHLIRRRGHVVALIPGADCPPQRTTPSTLLLDQRRERE